MGELGINKRGKVWLTVLLAFLIPGMGHIYNGQHSKGFLLLAGLLLDYTAIFRLADSDGGRHLLLIVYLCLMLPVFYFISVFDALQSIEKRVKNQPSIRLYHGICLMAAGFIMLILIKPPTFMLPWMNELAEWSVGPLLMIVAFLLISPIWRGAFAMYKLGRITAGVIIITVGTLLIWDLWQGRNDIALFDQWWPIAFIVLGFEVILYSTILRYKSAKLRLDVAGVSAALVVTFSAYAVTQYADFPVRWLDQFNVDLKGKRDFGEEKGYRYDKNVVKVPFDQGQSAIRIVNVNGDITIRADDVKEIELYTTVWVDLADEAEANTIAEKSTTIVSPGDETVIEGKGQLYGDDGNRLPKMNLEIVVPIFELPETVLPEENQISTDAANLPDSTIASSITNELESAIATSIAMIPTPDSNSNIGSGSNHSNINTEVQTLKLDIESGNGAVIVSSVNAQGGIRIKSNIGLIKLEDVYGSIQVAGNNGSIDAYNIVGETKLEAKNGSIVAKQISGGGLFASTLNGDLDLSNIYGDLDAETKNGEIKISEVNSSLKADTLNGSIEVDSSIVGGNWDIDSSVGEVKLIIPEIGHYSLYGSVTFGNITTDLPFEQSRKTIRGTIGDGTYRIHINATNSISMQRHIVSD
ncbi:DUF4097 family beta strand repeat protein [Paenibacillus sp. GSMTC-2017]|uniref:DUF4097 family beta strand repeat-containing protein n=1 Tax=Paenibacillus sp. GSMTC-2017 TaxID=2794350 RepID=UPI0018D78707|nr:DUF6677 family protein [Paenibacillus sp. GSMTC-2017]MBH5320236.1 DUF4097 family beta strand repeat protein [Paenibacillus sp. GSMTC-2017]